MGVDGADDGPGRRAAGYGALPNLVVIGAMKCGTTSLHHYLDLHPDVAMSRPKELNFFFGPADDPATASGVPAAWAAGNWHRGAAWYAGHFDPAAEVRGEASPGYTSPSHSEVAGRMAALVPDARLVYAVRDPIARAVSQYLHHRREGTERRSPEEALPDPGSQYIARGRYFERLAPFLATGAFEDRITLVAQEELGDDLRTTVRGLYADLRLDDGHWSADMAEWRNGAAETPPSLDDRLVRRLREEFADDADRLREFAGRDFPGWSV
jgi:hypothetical protein